MIRNYKRRILTIMIMLGLASFSCIPNWGSILVEMCEATGGTWVYADPVSGAENPYCNRSDTQDDATNNDESPVDEPGPDPEANPIDAFPADDGDLAAPAPLDALPDDQPGSGSTVSEWTVRLIPMDVRTIDTPPEIIAYANVEHAAPPETVSIDSQGDLWTYNANIALLEMGDWISATCTKQDVTAVGVRLEGDGNDGWVRVLVDGLEVWRGSIYGDQNSAEGMFLNYLEVSGLEPGTHTIRLENLGIAGAGGGIHVAMRFFGFSTRAVSVP